jgi:TolB-like protein/Tfp pilus assembly protein PilF
MLAGEVPFKGSTSRLIYQHQHATPPVDKLTHVPQQVITLLQVLLEKDPAQRLQTPTELLDAIPKVTEAVDSGRRVTADQLRSGADRIAARPKQSTRSLHPLLTGTRMHTFGWMLVLVLGIAGLLLTWFFFSDYGGHFFNRRVAEVVPTEKSIAVLPFENISANKDDAYFADGVQDEILNNLAKIAQLKVISRTSVMQYRTDTKRDLRQIASALGVANVLEGTVRRDGNHVRVSTELIDARNDNTVWADSYDRNLTDIFAIQSEVAQTIAGKLTATLSPEEKKRIEAKPTDNLEAYDLYLRAKEWAAPAEIQLFATSNAEALQEALRLLEQAIRLDSKFALAYCKAADTHDWLYRSRDPSAERRALAAAAIAKAMRLQPDLPEVHLAFAFHLYDVYRDYERARVQLAIAKRSLPNSAEAALLEGSMDRRQGNWEKVVREFKEAATLDPRNQECVISLGTTLLMMRRFAEGDQAADRLIDLLPDRTEVKLYKANISFLKAGDLSNVRKVLSALSGSTAESDDILFWHVSLALFDRNWNQATEVIEKIKSTEDNGDFAFVAAPVPVDCYRIMMSRLKGEQPSSNPVFAVAREKLSQKFQISEGDQRAKLLSQLAAVDALLDKKENAITEAKRAAEMLPISRDAFDGPSIMTNLAAVYAWSDQLDLAFATLSPLSKIPGGTFYGSLKLDPFWDPLRKDPRFDKLLAELAPRD